MKINYRNTLIATGLVLGCGLALAQRDDVREGQHEHIDQQTRNMAMQYHGGGQQMHGQWQRGQAMPMEYRNRQYVVNDWRGHGLRRPPYGYQWVQNGADFVLVAIATGVIADIFLGR